MIRVADANRMCLPMAYSVFLFLLPWFAILHGLDSPAATATEQSGSKTSDMKALIAQLNSEDRAKSAAARDKLLRKPLPELVAAAPDLFKTVKVGEPRLDDAAAVIAMFGPDCGDVLPAVLDALRAETKDEKRRELFVEIVALLGVSGQKALPTIREVAARDPSERVRDAAKRVVEAVNVTDVQVKDALSLLALRKYDNDEQREKTEEAIEWVQKRGGFNVELINAMTLLEIDGRMQEGLVSPRISEFFGGNPWAARIGLAVVEKDINGEDAKRRDKAADLLCELANNREYWPAELVTEKLVSAEKADVRKAVISRLPSLTRTDDWSWLQPRLREISAKDKDESVRKAARTALKAFEEERPKR